MTWKKAIKILNDEEISSLVGRFHGGKESLDLAISALRPVSRKKVEMVWRGEWKHTHSSDSLWTEVWVCSRCGLEDENGDCYDFCPSCGAPMTDEAVEITMRRLEELRND